MLGDASSVPAEALVIEGSDATFMKDVVEASKTQPVIVDFWATWCGPCKTLGPMLERQVAAAGGAVKLVKIDVDRNPAYAGQLRVQSIPTVYAFVNGQPVDGFQGAIPESEIKKFIDRVSGPPEPSEVDRLVELGTESLAVSDWGGAAQAFAQALQMEPQNVKALAGLARVHIEGGDLDQARQIAAMAPADSREPELLSVRSALELAANAPPPSELDQMLARVREAPGDHDARFELANALAAQNRLDEAADQLLTIVESDLEWNDQAARKQLLKVFEAAGPMSETARNGRRRLSSLLFS
ncbi:MAG: co-chaperone YbbN [Caulobacteraceae bacterium]|nr:co-chaperone YbbN [Caulobacteraceae bacterium]